MLEELFVFSMHHFDYMSLEIGKRSWSSFGDGAVFQLVFETASLSDGGAASL